MKNNKLYWTPRILTIIFILFLSIFSLDVFDEANNYTFWQTVSALLMHNIPVFIILIVFLFSWKKGKMIGGILIVFGLIYTSIILYNALNQFEYYQITWVLIIAGPTFVTGILYFIGEKEDEKSTTMVIKRNN